MNLLNEIKITGRIKECFFFNKDTCEGKIKSAHSIQKSKKLDILLKTINGNKLLYSLVDTDRDIKGKSIGMKGIGVKNASTFFGFCDFHDSKLFAPIENNNFDGSDLHCFLHSFRSFAHSYHTILENIEFFKKHEGISKLESIKAISRLYTTLEEVNLLKNQYQSIFDNGNFDELKYFIIEKPGIFPVACSGGFQVEYSLDNKSFRETNLPVINLTIFPEITDQTVIIFSWMPEDTNANYFIDNLEKLNDTRQGKVLTSLMIAYAENSFVSPHLWDKLNPKEKIQLLYEVDTSDPIKRVQKKKFWLSELNFFKSEYKLKIL